MMLNNKKILAILSCCTLMIATSRAGLEQAPKLTIVIVIDQLAYHYFPKLQANISHGFKDLFEQGIVYKRAYHPHAIPETVTGHNGISTGCYPKDHGGVTNEWMSYDGAKIPFEQDFCDVATIIPISKKNEKKSARKTMVDTLSDQFMQFNSEQTPAKVFALSIKSYPALIMAGKMGKALWFDQARGMFVSNEMSFSKLPRWVDSFNKQIQSRFTNYTWKTCFKENGPAYEYPFIHNYEFAGASESFINKSPIKINPQGMPTYFALSRSPLANELVLDCAEECINKNLDLQSNDRMLLWISLSQLDLLTHLFGPESMETIDSIYHLDQQIKKFMTFVARKVGGGNCLIALTADHGIGSIPEISQQQGLTQARRIMANQIITAMNNDIKDKFGITKIVKCFEPNFFNVDHQKFDHLSPTKQNLVLTRLVSFIKCYPGIKNAWITKNLANQNIHNDQFAQYYKTQLFPGRIGEIACLPTPHCQITNYVTGTSHSSPYEYDTHVPLVIYQPGKLQHKIITKRVFIPQLPVTIAHLLHITKPSASAFDILPGF